VTKGKHTDTTARSFAALALGAALLAACGTSQALSEASQAGRNAVVRDPDNPNWSGAATTVVTDAGERSMVVRDPDNPYWTGASADSGTMTYPAADPATRGPR
jgi:hypothetical protein